jgi:hypothetical protein
MASTTRALHAGKHYGNLAAIVVQAAVLVLLIALVGGAMLTVARPVTQADDTVEGNVASPHARHEPSSAMLVAGPPGGLLILLVERGQRETFAGVPTSILSTGGPLDISFVEVDGAAGRDAFLRAFADAESVCSGLACRPTWILELTSKP